MTNKVFNKTVHLLATGMYEINELGSYEQSFYDKHIITINNDILEVVENGKRFSIYKKDIRLIQLDKIFYLQFKGDRFTINGRYIQQHIHKDFNHLYK